ncbi:F-box domain containing protein [Tanacetum coccineum]
MSDNIPFDIQLAIMNRLPVKSLLQFRTVSKLWKYSIDCSDFVREYGFRESNNCCLYLTFKQNFEGVICSVDDNLALSPVVSNLKFFNLTPFATSEGVWCFSYGENSMLLIWNPSLKKSVRILVPNYLLEADSPKMLFGFGVHPVTLDPTLLKINYPYYGQGPWYVSVFTLSSRTWYKLDSYCLPRESIRIKRSGQAVVGGKIFWVIDMPEEMLVGQCLPPYYISQLGDCIIISGSFKFVDFSIIYAWELQVDDGEVSGCGEELDFNKWGEKLEQVVAIVKSCSLNALGDLNVTLKDLSGTVPGTINYKVLDVGSYGKDIIVGVAMILANVSVFTPKPSKHYLNITKRNVVEVFRKDTVLGSDSG